MTRSRHVDRILTALLAEVRRMEALPDRPPSPMDRERWSAVRRERKEYEQFGVRHDLARWLGHPPSPSESAVFSRTLRNMEMLGLLVRISRWGGTRSTHVRLTPLGRAEAERLAAEREAALENMLAGVSWALDNDATTPEETDQPASELETSASAT